MDNIANKKYASYLPSNFQYEFQQRRATFDETTDAMFGYSYDGTVKKIEDMFRWNIPHYFKNNPNPPLGFGAGVSYANDDYVQPTGLNIPPDNGYDPYEDMGDNYRGHHQF